MHARVPAAEAATVCLPGATIAITRAGKAWQGRPATASLCGLAPREARAPRLLRIGVPGPRGGRVRVRGRKACAVLTRCEDRAGDGRERVRAGGANGDPGWPRGADKASDFSMRRARGGVASARRLYSSSRLDSRPGWRPRRPQRRRERRRRRNAARPGPGSRGVARQSGPRAPPQWTRPASGAGPLEVGEGDADETSGCGAHARQLGPLGRGEAKGGTSARLEAGPTGLISIWDARPEAKLGVGLIDGGVASRGHGDEPISVRESCERRGLGAG